MAYPNDRFDDHGKLSYTRTVLYGCEAFEVVACEWNKQSVSALHNHGWSQCVVLVQEGCFENHAEFGLKTEVKLIEPGQVIVTPIGVEHEIRCMTEVGKTLHVYLPRITALDSQGHFSSPTLAELRERIDVELKTESATWGQVDQALNRISENAVSTHSPFFMNQLFSGIFPESMAAETVASRLRTTMATFEASPTFTAIELEIVEKLGELIGWPSGARDGIGVPGGSAANFMAVHCARQKRVPEFRKRGSQGERFKIYSSSAAHYSLQKACLATGLGTDALTQVSVDARGRMNPEELSRLIELDINRGHIPLMVCATAGTTVLGAFDPIDSLADICERFAVWLHVDGAWGGPALFAEKARGLVKGIERADSMTFDAHKLFGASLTTSFFLTKQQGILLAANDVAGGEYIFHSNEVVQDRGRMSWQCGRGPDALSFWTVWKNNGTAGLGKFVEHLFDIRNECVEWIKSVPRLKLIAEPEYLNICVRIEAPTGSTDANWSMKVREELKSQNIAFVNFSSDENGSFLRLILANPKISTSHVKSILLAALKVQ